jgi:hypothetical protein
MEPAKEYIMCVPDDHYAKLETLLETKVLGMEIKDKNGVPAYFYSKNGKIYSEQSGLTQEVVKMSSIPDVKRQHDPFREHLMSRLRNDFPDCTQDELDAHADILTEANTTIKNLIAQGLPKEIAYRIVQTALEEDITDSNIDEKIRACVDEVVPQTSGTESEGGVSE